MGSTRQIKVAKQIQRDLSDIFQPITPEISKGILLTITVVRISPDLALARVYISVFPSDNANDVIDKLDQMKSHIRNELGKKIRHQVKKIPELAFFLDNSLDYLDNIDQLLKP